MISTRFLVTLVTLSLTMASTFAAKPNQGSKSKVTALQQDLQRQGFLKKGIPYGHLGPLTKAALKKKASVQAKTAVPSAKPQKTGGFEMHASIKPIRVEKATAVHGKIWNFFFGIRQEVHTDIAWSIRKLYEGCGRATQFGGHDKYDNGVGHSFFNPNSSSRGLRTTNIKGVALTRKLLCEVFHLPMPSKHPTVEEWQSWEKVRRAGIKVWSEGHTPEVVHAVDFLGAGGIAVIDETWHLNQDQGGDGNHSFVILNNYFPPGHTPTVVTELKVRSTKGKMASR